MCNPASYKWTVAPDNLTQLWIVDTLQAKADRLWRMATGDAAVRNVVFSCGCSIERWEQGKRWGVRLVERDDDREVKVITLKGTADFTDFLSGAEQGGEKLAAENPAKWATGDTKLVRNLTKEIDEQGVKKFLEVNRECFARYVEEKAKTEPDTLWGCSGPHTPRKGRFRYIPIKQRLADSSSKYRTGLECLASSMVNALMCLGVVNPTMTREDFETRYTSLHGAPASLDDVRIDREHNLTLNGTVGHNTLIPIRGSFDNEQLKKIEEIFNDFQETDWAQLMDMGKNSTSLEVVDLRKATSMTPYVQEWPKKVDKKGCGVAFYSYTGIIYSDSQHFVTLDAIWTKDDHEILVYAENDRKPGTKSPGRVERKKLTLEEGIVFDENKSPLGRLLYTIVAK